MVRGSRFGKRPPTVLEATASGLPARSLSHPGAKKTSSARLRNALYHCPSLCSNAQQIRVQILMRNFCLPYCVASHRSRSMKGTLALTAGEQRRAKRLASYQGRTVNALATEGLLNVLQAYEDDLLINHATGEILGEFGLGEEF
jgi:hypothetical protein